MFISCQEHSTLLGVVSDEEVMNVQGENIDKAVTLCCEHKTVSIYVLNVI